MKISCRECGQEFEYAADIDTNTIGACTACGASNWKVIESSKLYPCQDCGNPISRLARFCPRCGANYRSDAEVTVTRILPPFIDVFRFAAFWVTSLAILTVLPGIFLLIIVVIFGSR